MLPVVPLCMCFKNTIQDQSTLVSGNCLRGYNLSCVDNEMNERVVSQ